MKKATRQAFGNFRSRESAIAASAALWEFVVSYRIPDDNIKFRLEQRGISRQGFRWSTTKDPGTTDLFPLGNKCRQQNRSKEPKHEATASMVRLTPGWWWMYIEALQPNDRLQNRARRIVGTRTRSQEGPLDQRWKDKVLKPWRYRNSGRVRNRLEEGATGHSQLAMPSSKESEKASIKGEGVDQGKGVIAAHRRLQLRHMGSEGMQH